MKSFPGNKLFTEDLKLSGVKFRKIFEDWLCLQGARHKLKARPWRSNLASSDIQSVLKKHWRNKIDTEYIKWQTASI